MEKSVQPSNEIPWLTTSDGQMETASDRRMRTGDVSGVSATTGAHEAAEVEDTTTRTEAI